VTVCLDLRLSSFGTIAIQPCADRPVVCPFPQKGNADKALDLLGEMESGALGDLAVPNEASYVAVIEALAAEGKAAEAKEVFARVKVRPAGFETLGAHV
jgi:hypothetical protein